MANVASFEIANNRFNKKRKLDSAYIAIEDKSDICSDIDKLLFSGEFSDVTIEVENERFKAHRVILAARSDFFRCLCYNGMRESNKDVIQLKDISKSTFRILLKYIYTGTIITDEMKSCIFELIYFSDCYCLPKLHKKLIKFLSENLDPDLTLKAYEIAKLYEIKELMDASLNYIENNPCETLYHPSFDETSLDCVRDILKSDTLRISEIKIYEILERYLSNNNYSDSEAKSIVKEIVRFPLISYDNIIGRLHFDGMFNVKECLELMKIKDSTRSTKINYRHILQKDTNYVISCQSCEVIKGQPEIKLAFASTKLYGSKFLDESKQDSVIEFTLGKRCKVNHIKMIAYIQPLRRERRPSRISHRLRNSNNQRLPLDESQIEKRYDYRYSYEVLVSPDQKHWETAFKSRVFSTLWQNIYFEPKIVKYLRIVVLEVDDSIVTAFFHLLNFQCFYSTKNFECDRHSLVPYFNIISSPKIPKDYPGPVQEEYYCTYSDRTKTEKYNIFSAHDISDDEDKYLLFTLCQDCYVDTIVVHLWDRDQRLYDFDVSCGVYENDLEIIESRKRQRGEQIIRFRPMVIRFIKLKATAIYNARTDEFRVINLEVYKQQENR
ncbi:BTB/POZ domain-containing protein 9-like isoform X1 [Dinothrombium tinctorium]|uniref:BTB/POZ domain-containing protein 9-like isoform X1 n=1 Tax=Dinothrombium tinctorium TaxID=1965070 RepID=A0A3S3P8W3_9ACAR|nr:BTB/POZ domain-containing protein 9-like isoform X1 [Dinothrombium tinctorium]RWS11450.1 BTB/POZ domain-containing protein 9-like isoform X1 [Dinothrombium tinctorium]